MSAKYDAVSLNDDSQTHNSASSQNSKTISVTPAVVKRRQLSDMFTSPTDNILSPCTARLIGAQTKPKPRILLKQAAQPAERCTNSEEKQNVEKENKELIPNQ